MPYVSWESSFPNTQNPAPKTPPPRKRKEKGSCRHSFKMKWEDLIFRDRFDILLESEASIEIDGNGSTLTTGEGINIVAGKKHRSLLVVLHA